MTDMGEDYDPDHEEEVANLSNELTDAGRALMEAGWTKQDVLDELRATLEE